MIAFMGRLLCKKDSLFSTKKPIVQRNFASGVEKFFLRMLLCKPALVEIFVENPGGRFSQFKNEEGTSWF